MRNFCPAANILIEFPVSMSTEISQVIPRFNSDVPQNLILSERAIFSENADLLFADG